MRCRFGSGLGSLFMTIVRGRLSEAVRSAACLPCALRDARGSHSNMELCVMKMLCFHM
jgi:hypothetical protein